MASRAFIPITDHNMDGVCSDFYSVRFKLGSVSYWAQLTNVQPVLEGSPAAWGIVLSNLEDDLVYDYEITRHCCDGVNSVAASGNFETTV